MKIGVKMSDTNYVFGDMTGDVVGIVMKELVRRADTTITYTYEKIICKTKSYRDFYIRGW